MIVKLLTEHHLEFLSFKGGCRGSSESTLVDMPHCWKAYTTAHFIFQHKVAAKLVTSTYKTVNLELARS